MKFIKDKGRLISNVPYLLSYLLYYRYIVSYLLSAFITICHNEVANGETVMLVRHHNRNYGHRKWLNILGIVLFVFSYVLYGGILLVPFTSFNTATKGLICTVLLILKGITWWMGVIILGKEFLSRYFKYLNIFRSDKKQDCCKHSQSVKKAQ